VTRDLTTRLLFVLGPLLRVASALDQTDPTAACVFIGFAVLALWAIPKHSKHAISRIAIVGSAAALGWAVPKCSVVVTLAPIFRADARRGAAATRPRWAIARALIATEEYSPKARAAGSACGNVLIASLCG